MLGHSTTGPAASFNNLNQLDEKSFSLSHAAGARTQPPEREEIAIGQLNKLLPDDPPRPNNSLAFLVHGIASAEECDLIKNAAMPLLESTSNYFAQRHRVTRRALIMSDHVARDLFQRLLPHLRLEDYAGRIPLCFGHGGAWYPVRLNSCLKVVEYARGGHFADHRDGPWIPREDEASIFTVLLYLNTVGAGAGQTILHGCLPAPTGQREQRFNQGGSKLVEPRQGSMLVFNHDCWHGSMSTNERKYILRTEVIFRRSHAAYVDRYLYRGSDEYAATKRLYESSMAALESGDREGFFTMYQDVIEHQRAAMLQALAAVGPQRAALAPDVGPGVLSHILSFAGLGAIVPFMLANRATYYATVQLPLWFDQACADFPAAVASANAKYLLRSAVLALPAAGAGDDVVNNSSFPFVPLDWMTILGQLRRREFAPSVVTLSTRAPILYLDARAAKTMIDRHSASSRGIRKSLKCIPDGSISQVSVELPSFFANWSSGYPLHMNQPNEERFELSRNGERDDCEPSRSVSTTDIHVDWSILSIPLEVASEPTQQPYALVACPHWFVRVDRFAEAQVRKKLLQVEQAFLEQTRAPAVLLLHPAVLAALHRRTLSDASTEDELLHAARHAVLQVPLAGADPAAEAPASISGSGNILVIFATEQLVLHCSLREDDLFPIGPMDAFEPGKDLCSPILALIEAHTAASGTDGDVVIVMDLAADESESLERELIAAVEHFQLRRRLHIVDNVDLSRVAHVVSRTPLFRQLCTFRW